MLKRYALIFLISCLATVSFGQAGKLKFEKLGTRQGLSQSTVKYITQDSVGFMWFATTDGLNKYDGYNFQVFKKSVNNKTSLSANDIRVLNRDDNNQLWIGTASGDLNLLDMSKQSFVANPYPAINNTRCIYQDKKGNTWVGTEGQGVYLIHKNKIKRFSYNPQSTSFSILYSSSPNTPFKKSGIKNLLLIFLRSSLL